MKIKKEIVIMLVFVVLVLVFIISFSGCISNVMEGEIKTKEGFLINIIDNTFIFKDNTYLDVYDLGHYNETMLKSFINHDVRIKVTDRMYSELVSIEII